MRRAVLCVGLIAVAACADTPTAPRTDGSEQLRSQEGRVPVISKPSVVRLEATTLLSDCENSEAYRCTATKIWIGSTAYVGLAVTNTSLLREAFSSLRSPGQLSFVVDSDTIPAPPTPGPYRWALAKGDAQLQSLLTQAGLVFSDTIPGPPAPFMLANYDAGTGLMVLSVDELYRKKVIVAGASWVNLEVNWTIKTPLGPVTYALAAQLPPSDTIPSDCYDEADPDC